MSRPTLPSRFTVTITPGTLVGLLLIAALGFALWKIGNTILVILAAVVLAAFIESLSKVLMRRLYLPRIPAVIIVYILTAGVIALLIFFFNKTLISELGGFAQFAQKTPLLESFQNLAGSSSQEGALDIFQKLRASFEGGSGQLASTVQAAFGGLINLLLVIVISFYLSIEDRGVEQFLRAVTPLQHEEYIISIWRRTEYKIGAWFKGQLLQAVILAALTYLGLFIIDTPFPFALSLLAGVLGLIPFGILLAGLVAVVVGYLGGGLHMGLLVLLLYAILQQFENYVLQPLIINRATGVPPLVVLLSVVIGVALIGFMGLILAIPAAVVIMELLRDYEEKKRIEMALVNSALDTGVEEENTENPL